MKIALVNTYDIQGGAARAAYRLHQGFQTSGQDSVLVSRVKVASDDTVLQVTSTVQDEYGATQLDAIQSHSVNLNRSGLTDTIFSFPYPGFDLSELEPIRTADIINLHWVAQFQSPATLKALFDLNKPVVWTLHDMWAFTGGCHYSAGCPKYELDCAQCLQLQDDPFNLAANVLSDKVHQFAGANLTIVTPSQWLSDCARRSRLFQHCRVETIPNGLETEVFTPQPEAIAKESLGLPPDTITLLFGADNVGETRKGFNELLAATRICLENQAFRELASAGKVQILCFGYPSPLLKILPIPVRSFGHITSDETLSTLYSAADVFVLPSLEDNLPNTMVEAMSCGTPVIGFDVGGIPDCVKDGQTGRLVPLQASDKMAEAILDCVFNVEHYRQMGHTCRRWVETHHSTTVQATRYLSLFQELLHPSQDRQSLDKTAGGSLPLSSAEGDLSMTPLEPKQTSVLLDTTVGSSASQAIERLALKAVTAKLTTSQTELHRTQADLAQTYEQLQQTQTELQHTRTELEQVKITARKATADFEYVRQELDAAQQKQQQKLAAATQTIALLQNENEQGQRQVSHLNAVLATEKEASAGLRQQLQVLNTTRTQLTRLTQELQGSKEQLNQRIKQLRQENRQLNRESRELKQSIEHLEQELAYRSTGKAAIRQLIKTTLRKTGVYGFVYRNYKAFVPIYNLLFLDRWKPATINEETAVEAIAPSPVPSTPSETPAPAPAVSDASELDLQAPMISAAVLARSLGLALDTPDEYGTVKWLAERMQSAKRALIVNPDATMISLVNLLAQQGAVVTLVGDLDAVERYVRGDSVEQPNVSLGDWLKTASDQGAQYDVIGVNGRSPHSDIQLLNGRFSVDATVFVTHADHLDSSQEWVGWGKPDIQTALAWIYQTPPAAWQQSARLATEVNPYQQWPWNYPAIEMPPTMPSGKPWPKISIVTVTFNQGAFIEETLRSVINQGYPNLEYIVLDGGSTDQTRSILERYDSHLAYWVSEPDNGQSNALNKGFQRATGDIVAWLNSDDCYLPFTLFKVALAFDTYGADMVAGGCQLRHDNNPTPFKTHHSAMPLGEMVPLPLERLLDIDNCWFKGEFFYQPEVFWTRDLWQRAGGYVDEELFYSMDYELWVRMAVQKAQIIHVPDPLCLFRFHESQKTHGDAVPYLPELKQVAADYRAKYLEGVS